MKNYRKYFIKAIKENFPAESDNIIADTACFYKDISPDTSFAATSRNPIDKRLDFCSYFLALIKALDKRGQTFEIIRRTCLAVIIDYVRPKNKVQHLLKRLPVKLVNTRLGNIILKAFHKRVSKNSNPDGFIAAVITDKSETFGLGYGIDILECGICKLFSKYNYQNYTSILCEVDAITSQLAGLELVRTGTIATGAQKCDFRFKRHHRA